MLKRLLKIGISLLLLTFLVSYAGLEQTLAKLSQASLWALPAGVAIYCLSQFVSAYRWQFLSAQLGFELPLSRYFALYMSGMFFSLFLPGSIGGDVLRLWSLAQETGRRKREASLTLLAERGLGLMALLMLTCSLTLVPQPLLLPAQVTGLLWILSGVGALGLIGLRWLPWQYGLKRLPQATQLSEWLTMARPYWANTALLFKSVGLSLLTQVCMVTIHVLIAQALGINVPLVYLALVYGVVAMVAVLPVSFNGLGVREGAYVSLLAIAGVPAQTGLAFGLYWFMVSSATSLLGGLFLWGKPLPSRFFPANKRVTIKD
jgi:uncharacterized membrane protein YbhN (UPF0104 family)